MRLKELIEKLEKAPQDKVVKLGIGNPHSWRGNYAELAFEPVENVSISKMLSDAKSCLGKTFEGWKGGDYEMSENTRVNIAYEGSCDDELSMMLLIENWINN